MIYASTAIILNDKKIFLIKRSNYTKTFPNTWACPGGISENSESPKQAVIREVKEETNLDFVPTELFCTGQYMDRKLYRFLGKWSGSIIIQDEEICDHGWFDYDKAIKLSFGFDYKKIIEKLHLEKYI